MALLQVYWLFKIESKKEVVVQGGKKNNQQDNHLSLYRSRKATMKVDRQAANAKKDLWDKVKRRHLFF